MAGRHKLLYLWEKLMNKKGLTLVEVTTVLSILGIMSAISIPSYLSWIPRHRLQTSVRHIYDDMNKAKFRAVNTNTVAVIVFSIPNNTYTAFLDSNGNWALDSSETIVSSGTVEKDVNIYGSTLTSNTYGFNNRGMAASAPGRVFLTNPTGLFMGIEANIAGNVKVISSNDGGSTWS